MRIRTEMALQPVPGGSAEARLRLKALVARHALDPDGRVAPHGMKALLCDPEALGLAGRQTRLAGAEVSPDARVIAGIGTAAAMLATAVRMDAAAAGRPLGGCIVEPPGVWEPLGYRVHGTLVPGAEVLVVAGGTEEGLEIGAACEAVSKAGAVPTGAVVIVDRGQDTAGKVRDRLGVRLAALFTEAELASA